MSTERPDAVDHKGGQCDRQGVTISFGWQVLAIMVLSVVFPLMEILLVRVLGIAEGSSAFMFGIIVAVIMIGVTAPKSFGQLCIIVAVVAAGGTLAILTALAVRTVAGGLWGAILGAALASGLGGAAIVLSYIKLGVGYRLPSREDGI